MTKPAKVKSPRKALNEILERLDDAKERRAELYEEYKNAKTDEQRLEVATKVRSIDLLLEQYFLQAHTAYQKFSDELEEVDRYKGVDRKTRIVYCEGSIHLTTSKGGKYLHGHFCNC